MRGTNSKVEAGSRSRSPAMPPIARQPHGEPGQRDGAGHRERELEEVGDHDAPEP